MTEHIHSLEVGLQNKRTELVQLIRAQSPHLVVDEIEHELTDRMLSMSRRDEACTLLNTLSRTLSQVDAALMAVKLGVYGICVECDEPISRRRLEVLPWALHCIRCQTAIDRGDQMCPREESWNEAA